jgi:F-type H+-transporting ATPase subunit gamma
VVVGVVFGSDQGLVGRFNDVVTEHAVRALTALPGRARVCAVGERVQAPLAEAGLTPSALFNVPSSVQAIAPLVGQILLEAETQRGQAESTELHLFYNRPTTSAAGAAAYAPVSLRLLPLDSSWIQELAALPWPTPSRPEVLADTSGTVRALIHEYLFISLFRACAESLASENTSRLAAMQRADKNIEGLLEQLRGTFHRLRQGGIDEELFDVVAGFEAQRPARERGYH